MSTLPLLACPDCDGEGSYTVEPDGPGRSPYRRECIECRGRGEVRCGTCGEWGAVAETAELGFVCGTCLAEDEP